MEHLWIGLPLNKVEAILKDRVLEYSIEMISGGKDSEVLTEPYVVRVKKINNRIDLVVTGFKTTI